MNAVTTATSSQTAEPKHLAFLIFLSYRFSQGGIGTQNRILLHLAENYHPRIMSDAIVREVTQKAVGKYFLNPRLHPASTLPWERESTQPWDRSAQMVADEIEQLYDRFDNRALLSSFDGSLSGIAQSLIIMDIDYLRRPGGRAGSSEELRVKVGPYAKDAYSSVYVKHCIFRTPTGSPEYDQIFHSLGSRAVISEFDMHSVRLLMELLELYTHRHPASPRSFLLEQMINMCRELVNAGKP